MHPGFRKATASFTTFVFALMFVDTGCKSSTSSQTATTTPGQDQAAPNQAAPLSVDDLVAPIALYPDQLLGQVLTASTNPQEVLDVGNWLLQNQNLQGDALANAAKAAGFSVSAQYLVLFPQVVDNMCQEMDWTRQLGEAFKTDQKSVMDAIQRKRLQAQQVGNLQSSPQMTVDTKTDNGQQYVEIKPADPKVVYVPQYNPVTIYNTQAAPAPAPAAAPAASTTTTTESSKSGVSTGTAVAIGLLSFGVGMAVGSAISNNNNYYPYPAWGYGGMYYGGRPYYSPPYRPPVYPGYRPVYGYNPPPNYRWNEYNHNVNVNVNNNYYGRFNNNNVNINNRPSTLPANNRPGTNNGYLGANNNNRPGQGNRPTTYQGARPSTPGQRPGASMASVNPNLANRPNSAGGNAASRPGNLGAGNPAGPGANMRDANRSNNAGGANRPNNAGINRPNASPGNQPMNRGGDRGYASNASTPTARPSAPAVRPTPSTQQMPAARTVPAQTAGQNRGGIGGAGGGNNGAFAGGSGRADRAASNRGRASMGAAPAGGRGARHFR